MMLIASNGHLWARGEYKIGKGRKPRGAKEQGALFGADTATDAELLRDERNLV